MHDWHYFFHHVPHNLDKGSYRIFEPQWKAEILQWFGREDVAKEQKEEFIKALIDFDDGCGDFYRYRAYFLAGEAIAHFPDCSKGDEIVGQLLKWSYAYFRQDKRDWTLIPAPLAEAARAVLEATDRKRVIAAFVELLHATESQFILRHAAERLGRLDPGNKSAIAALVLLLQITQAESTLQQIIRSLEAIGSGDETAIAALVHLMETTPSKPICLKAIDSLEQIGYGNRTAIAALVRFLQINQGDNICFEAAQALWQIDPGNVAAIAALVYILETTQNPCLLKRAAEYLRQIAPGNIAAIAALSERLETNRRDEYFRCRVAASLMKFAPGNAAAIATLVQILETTQNKFNRLLVAESLAHAEAYRQTAIDTLLELAHLYWEEAYLVSIGDEPSYLPAIPCLKKIDPSHQLAVNALVQLIQTKKELFIIHAVAELEQLGAGNEAAIAALVELLASTQDEYLQMRTATSLGRVDPGNQIAIAALVHLIDATQNKQICEHTIAAFGKIEPGSEIAIAALVKFLRANQDDNLCFEAAKALWQIDPGNPATIATLIEFIQTFHNEAHLAESWLSSESYLLEVADSVREILQSEHLPQVVVALKDYLSEPFYKNASYRYEAVYSLIWHCTQTMTYPDFYNAWHD